MNLRTLNRLLLLKESAFGLPWIICSALLAYRENLSPVSPLLPLWIVLAFLAARSFGMGLNRWIDCEIDKRNPRTQDRPFASGLVSKQVLLRLIAYSLILFLTLCWAINATCLWLSLPALGLMSIYSYTKRFTFLCHFVLGLVHFLGVLMAWAAVGGQLSPPPFLLALALFCSIAATDILYAFQDREWDRQNQIFSIPALFSAKTSMQIAQGMHVTALLFLLIFGLQLDLPWIYFIGIGAVAFLWLKAYRSWTRERIASLFFRLNSLSGFILLIFTIGSLIWENIS